MCELCKRRGCALAEPRDQPPPAQWRLHGEAVRAGVWKPLEHQGVGAQDAHVVWRRDQERARVLDGKRRLAEARAAVAQFDRRCTWQGFGRRGAAVVCVNAVVHAAAARRAEAATMRVCGWHARGCTAYAVGAEVWGARACAGPCALRMPQR